MVDQSLTAAVLRILELLGVTLALSLFLPDKFLGMQLTHEVEGYVRDVYTGKPLRYRLNGIWVTLTTVALYIVLVGRDLRRFSFCLLTFRFCSLIVGKQYSEPCGPRLGLPVQCHRRIRHRHRGFHLLLCQRPGVPSTRNLAGQRVSGPKEAWNAAAPGLLS